MAADQLAAASPTIQTINPSNGTAGTVLTLTGQNIGQSPAVTLGSETCVVTESSDQSVTCIVPSLSAGLYPIVLVADNGATDVSVAPLFGLSVTVTDIQSATPFYGSYTASGSIYGGHAIRIAGSGFPAAASAVHALVGGVSCAVTQSNSSQFTCVTPATIQQLTDTSPVATVDVDITVFESAAADVVLPFSAAHLANDFIEPGCQLGVYGFSVNCETGLFDPLIAHAFMSRGYTDCTDMSTACLYSDAGTEPVVPTPVLKTLIWSEFETPLVSRGQDFGSVDVGEHEFNRLFALSPNKIIKRWCWTCNGRP